MVKLPHLIVMVKAMVKLIVVVEATTYPTCAIGVR